MPDAPADPGHGGAAKLAIGLAVVALVVVAVAVSVVVMRDGAPARAAVPEKGRLPVAEGPEIVVVDARDVVRMERGTVDPTSDPSGAIGIKINDPELLSILRLEATDVITSISGTQVRRQFDVHDALAGANLANATTLYVELVRAGKPVLVKWEIEGDLREARTGVSGRPTRLPMTPLAPDPLGDTVKRVTDFDFELPRSTLLQLGANAQSGMSVGVRAVPAVRNGLVEGVKLYAIRPGSVWSALGLKNGDTILTVNGRPILTSTMADDFERLKGENALEIAITRRTRPETLKYTITK